MVRAVLLSFLLAFGGAAEAGTTRKKAPAKTAPAPPPRPAPPAAPPTGSASQGCALDGLPEAIVAWDPYGWLWLLESGDVLYVADLGGPLPALGTTIRCGGKKVHVETLTGGANLSMMNFDLDFSSVIAVEAPRRTPEARAMYSGRRALEAGDVEGARRALRPLDRADEDVAGLWVWVSRLEAKAGRVDAAHEALRGLSLEVYGVAAAHVTASRLSLAEARRLHAEGRTGEAALALAPAEAALGLGIEPYAWPDRERLDVLELAGALRVARGDAAGALGPLEFVLAKDPARPQAWLALGDARWALKDKKGARLAYAEAYARLPEAERPAELAERCPKCGG